MGLMPSSASTLLPAPGAPGATGAAPETAQQEATQLRELPDHPWALVVWDDPVNLMSYVSYVFRSYFGFERTEAHRLMLLVHEEGRAVVATGSHEEMERHVEAMHDFGLWASLQKVGG